MAEKQQPGGFVPPNGNYPSAPPSYQQVMGAQYPDPNKGQIAQGYSTPYPTASGAPPYFQQQGQQNMAQYPNYSQQPQNPNNGGYAYPGKPTPNAVMSYQPPTGYAPYPKVKLYMPLKLIQVIF